MEDKPDQNTKSKDGKANHNNSHDTGDDTSETSPEQTKTAKKTKRSASSLSDEPRSSKRTRLQYQPFQSPTLHIPQLRPTKPNEEKQVVYVKGEFLALRNESGSYFICQAAQNVYKSSHRFRIRWLSKIDGPPGAPQKYSRDFYDHTDFECVLTNIQMERLDKNLFRLPKDESLRTETILKRAINLENGIHDAEPEQSDKVGVGSKNDEDKKKNSKSVVTAVRSTVEPAKPVNLRHPTAVNASKHPSSTRAAKSKLRKVILKSRLKAKASKGSKVKVKQKLLREAESRGSKKRDNKVVTKHKPKVVTEKEKLKPNTKVSLYSKDPTFESNNSIPFVSTLANSKLLIRAVLMKDLKTLQSVLHDSKPQSWIGVHRSVDQKLDALAYALLQNNHKAVELILNERQNSRKSAIKMPDTLLLHHTVGRSNFKSLGSVVREISLSRGGREGNSALMKDCYEELSDVDYINLLLRYGVSNETLDLFCSQKSTGKQSLKSIAISNAYRAVLYGHRHLAAHLIDEALKLDGYGFTALHKEALQNDKQDLSPLRADAATKRASGNCGITPIHCAAINPVPKYLKQLIDSEPDYNVGDLHLHKPIHYASASETPACLELLLARGVKYDEIDVDGNTPLHVASETGRVANVELILKRAKADKRSGDDHKASRDYGLGGINRPNRASHTPLHLACIEGHLEVVRSLVKHGADIEKPTGVNKNRITPLMLACQHGHLEIVKLLMMSSVKLEARDKLRRTGLTHAIINGHAHIASNLLRLGADPDTCDSSGNSLLHYAVAYGWWFCVKLLLDAVSSINYTNDWKVTPLGIAFLKGHMGLVEHLLSLPDIDVEFQDDNGMSIVMLAVCSPLTTELVDLISALIHDKKAKCAISDIHGNTALHWLACNSIHLDGGRELNEMGTDGPHLSKQAKTASLNSPAIKGPIICNEAVQTSLDVAKLLLDNGCDPSVRNHRGQTVLTLAIQQGNNELVKLLLNDGNQVTAEVDDTGENLLHALVEHSYETDLAALVQVIKDSPSKKMKSPATDEVEKTLINPSVPLVENVDGILRVGDAIIISGYHVKSCEKFSVDLVQGSDLDKDDVSLGCTITVSGPSPVLVCNRRTGGEWKKDTKEVTLPPVCNSVEGSNDVKTRFELTIMLQEEQYQVSVGELAAVEFPTDVLPKQVTCLHVAGNITLTCVQVQRSAISKAVLPSVSLPSDVLREMAQTYSYDGFTPLLLACSRYHFSSDKMHQGKLRDMIKTLVEEAESEVHAVVKKRSDNKSRDIDGYSALHFLANAKEYPAIIDSATAAVPGLLLMLSYKPPINIQDHRGRTPLITAILSRQATAAKAMIDAGADINLCSGDMDDDGRACPLILAAKLGLVSVIKLLLKHGANVQLADEKNHSTALHYAVTMKSSTDALEVVRCLVDAGININSTNQDGRTPLHLAVNANRGSTDDMIEVEDLLIERGGDLLAKDSLGRLPLHYAFVKIGKPADSSKIDPIEVVSLLTSAMKGLNLDVADHYGQTPLHCAAFRGATISCVHLAQSMSTLNAKDKNGNAALSLAVLGSHDSCAIMLLQKGANVQVDVVIPPADKLSHEIEAKPTWQWKAIAETPMLPQRSPLLQEVVQKDWQGVMYMMLGQLQTTGANYFPAIEAAVRTKKFKLALNLIARGKNWDKFNMTNKDEQNLLHVLASVSGSRDQPELQVKVAIILLNRGVQHNVPDKFGSYPITYAAMNRNTVLCNFFTDQLGVNTIVKLAADKLGRTPLSAAFWSLGLFQWRDPQLNDLREWCKSLCDHGATCNVLVAYPYLDNYPGESWASLSQTASQRLSDSSCQISPLIYAVCLRDYDLVAFLLQQGADINFPDENGRTSLMHAVRKNDLGMVKLLLNLNYCYKQDMWHYLQKRRLNKFLCGKELCATSKAVVPTLFSTPKLRPPARTKPVRPIKEEATNGGGGCSSNSSEIGTAPDEVNGTGHNTEEKVNSDAMVDCHASPTLEKESADEKDEKIPEPEVKQELKAKGIAVSLTATDKHGWTAIHHLIRPFSCGTYDNEEILQILTNAGAPLNISDTAGFSPLQMAVQSRAYRLAAALGKSLSGTPQDMPNTPVVELSAKDGVQWEQEPWDYKVDAATVLERVESEAMEEGEEDALVLPDVHSGMEEMGEVVMDTEQNIPYDVFMTKVDLSGGVGSCYSFFKMQVISQQGRNLYVFFTRWGKLGMEGEYQQTPHCSSDDAIREFCRNFKAKSGNNWTDVKNFQPIPRKYRLVEALRRGRRKLRDIPLNLAMEVPSKLPQPLKDLMRDLTHLPMLQEACQDVGIDTAVMPFERLCEAALLRGRQILKELKNVVTEKMKLDGDLKFRDKVAELAEKVIDLSSEYYQVVPQPGYIYEKVRPLERLQDIQNCLESLEYMFDLELVSKILLGAQLRIKEINPMDYVYRAMDCQVCAMQEDDVEAQYILQYIYNTSLSHRPSVEKIYRVSRKEESTRPPNSARDDRWLLWHGISVAKMISVLTRGFPLDGSSGKPHASANKEVRFTDSFEMSRRMCRNHTKPTNNTQYSLLCEVSTGQEPPVGGINGFDHDQQVRKIAGTYFPDPSCNLILSSGVTIPLGLMTCKYNSEDAPIHSQTDYNEYVVNRKEQVSIRYIVCYHYDYVERHHKVNKVPTHS